jgi:hypothetical protein
MTRDEVVALMRQCAPAGLKNGRVDQQQLNDLMPLVQLIVAAERERCACICEDHHMSDGDWCARRIRESK